MNFSLGTLDIAGFDRFVGRPSNLVKPRHFVADHTRRQQNAERIIKFSPIHVHYFFQNQRVKTTTPAPTKWTNCV